MKDEDILNEAVRLLGSVPERATFRHDLEVNQEWCGAVLSLMKATGDHILQAEARSLVSNLETTPIVDRNPRSRLLTILHQVKREYEVKLGYSIPRNYQTLSESEVLQLQTSASQLSNAVQSDNELSSEARQIALYEIAIFEASLNAARLSPDIISRFVNGFLRGAIILSGGTLVKEAASRLVDQLLKLMGWAA